MKKILLKPFVILTAASFTTFGCASSNQDSATETTDNLNRTESVTTGGMASENNKNQLDVLVIEEKMMVPVATMSVTALVMENPVKVNDMFADISDTEKYDVLALAKSSPNLSTFVKLLEQANLIDDLQRVKEATLLAPTNEAFAKMPREKLNSLLSSENTAALSRLLQAHIIASDVSSVQFRNNSQIRISENTFIPISQPGVAGANVRVGGAEMLKTDAKASNGRIHVIDSVILPSVNFQEGKTR